MKQVLRKPLFIISEVARVLKRGGKFFISDPRPNACDTSRFVDDYMQLKKDGHIKFYTKDEWKNICGESLLEYVTSFDTDIRFPKKKDTAFGYEDILKKHDKDIIDSYKIEEAKDEIWITEEVNNIIFIKKAKKND